MASERPNAAGEVSQAPSATTGQTRSKLKRRRVKREGPPQLQFVIATDPSQFRDENAKRSVRSQAMIHWRHEENKKRGQSNQGDDLASTSSAPACDASARSKNAQTFANHGRDTLAIRSASKTSDFGPAQLERIPSHTESASLTPSQGAGHFVGTGSSSWQLSAVETASYFPQFFNKIHALADQAVTHYEESERHGERQLRAMIVGLATFYNIGSSHDPFDVLPQFRNRSLNSLYLSRLRAFASDSTIKKWLPLMLSHPHIILSSTVLASTWLDMQNKFSGDSTTTAMVKAETISMISERLVDPNLQLGDATLTVILHLFAGEMWVCNEKVLRIHENGVASIISRRGGLSTFVHNRAIAEVALACCYHCDIFCEAEILPAFQDGLLADNIPNDEIALPESPLYCPRHTFLTIPDDPQCSSSTLELLADMRDLTNIFVAHKISLNTIHDIDTIDIAQLSPPDEAYEATIYAIRARVAALPSAHTPGLSVSGDWVYEACRIASSIYTTAIALGVPFPVAADPNHVDFSATPSSSTTWNSNEEFVKPHLTEALYETLQRADTSHVWKNMSGVLYWVSAVGAAAARIPSAMDMTQHVSATNVVEGAEAHWILCIKASGDLSKPGVPCARRQFVRPAELRGPGPFAPSDKPAAQLSSHGQSDVNTE
ncbi:hypothetical protein OPT61_g3842 [Boeremia exigua]|uniref:Uncharacterized protein n=1 Tax=Boeremia exigua TaxID=749465 RepID=A0ACC2IGG3_9PLEO|nr:hypothetical protein OPT61_g3842 [Boeremia exigua]